ncbi:MAG: hypothetical protein AAF791_09345 [Bacteroidota bacterium]
MLRLGLLLALAVSSVPLGAQPLNPEASPRHGTLQLAAGGSEALDLVLDVPETHPEVDCVGTLNPSAPDAVVEWRGSGPMRLWVRSAADATLTVVGPDGQMECVDDEDGVQPALLYERPQTGRYAVWVGAFGIAEMGGTEATLYAGSPPEPVRLGAATEAPMLAFDGGSEVTMDVDPGGLHHAEDLGMPDYCPGFYHAEPTARVSGVAPYAISATSDTDLTLAVRTRGGGWLCNDDQFGFGDTDPGVDVQGEGEHTVWVGTFRGYARTESPSATLIVSAELDGGETLDPVDPGMFDPRSRFSEATYVPLDLDADGMTATLAAADETVEVSVEVGEVVSNPLAGDNCNGYIPVGRTLTLAAEGSGPITLHATGDADLVMAARDADGQWFCSDDATGRDPAIEVQAGDTAIWIGTFSDSGEESATLIARRGAIDDVLPPPDEIDLDFDDLVMDDPIPYSEGLYDGNELGGAAEELTLTGGGVTRSVAAGGDLPNPVEGDACVGHLTAAPTAQVASVAETLAFTASPDQGGDLMMVVQAPDGRWFCSDDHNGLSPGIEVSGAGDGTYTIWVGTFGRLDTPVDATLRVQEGPLPPGD